MRSLIRRERTERAAIYVALAIASVVLAFPILWMVSVSMKTPAEAFALPPRLIPEVFRLDAYQRVIENKRFTSFIVNSYVVGIAVTLLSVLLGTLAAYAFARFEFFGRRAAKLFVIVTQMVPSITLLIPFFGVIVYFRLYDTLQGLVLTYLSFGLPYSIVMMTAYLNTIPRELDEAALIDGCSRMRLLFRVLMPIAAPGLISTAIYTFLLSWNEFLFALALTRSNEMRTVPVGISMLIGEFGLRWDEMMAFSVIGSAPVLVLFVIVQRYVVSGLSAGGVKG
jgi:multiple sugar transport system permease protein